MKKKSLFSIIGLVAIVVFIVIYAMSTFSLFDLDMKKIAEIKVPNKNCKISIIYIPSNVTSQNYIQVRKIEDDIEIVLENFERYDKLVWSELQGDSLLRLVLKNTKTIKQDTVIITLD